jgi:GNAT superfamily N-acetyltransferase
MVEDHFISSLTLDDVPDLLKLSQEAGWPHSAQDWETVVTCGRGWGLRLHESVIATGTLFDYRAVATFGMMIVAKSHRSQGLGTKLMKNTLQRPSQQPICLVAGTGADLFYTRFGFRPLSERVLKLTKTTATAQQGESLASTSSSLVPLAENNLPKVLKLDWQETGMHRSPLIQYRWQQSSRALVTADDSGYGLANYQGDQLVVGPIVAKTIDTAVELVQGLTQNHEGPLRIDTYQSQHKFVMQLRQKGFKIASEQAIMVREDLQELPGNRHQVFALASQSWM